MDNRPRPNRRQSGASILSLTVVVTLGMILSTALPAQAWRFDNFSFYGGQATYNAKTNPADGGKRTYSAPRVERSKYGMGMVCDYMAAMDVWINGYYYPIDYSSFHSGCSWYFGYFDYHGWTDTFFPTPQQSYTWGWWHDSDTGGQFPLVGHGWI